VYVATTSTTWPNANEAFYIRVVNPTEFTPSFAWWFNGATVNGNMDVGIYTTDFVRLGSTGAVAQADINQVQVTAFATTIPAGELILGISSSSATATIRMWTPLGTNGVNVPDTLEAAQQTSAHVLPNPAVPAQPTDFQLVPAFGFYDALD
jgi:hypothetical protein